MTLPVSQEPDDLPASTSAAPPAGLGTSGGLELQAYTRRGLLRILRSMLRRPSALVAVIIIAALIVVAVLAPLLTPHDPTKIDLDAALAGPSSGHWLGTDSLGRDNLSRLVYGARVALQIAIPSILGAFVIGASIGLIVGYVGGVVDKVFLVLFDAVISFPSVILGLALLTLLGPSKKSVVLVIAVSMIPYYGRLARAQTLSQMRNEYVRAERALGASRARVLRTHVMPNALAPLLVIVAIDIPTAIAIEAGLAFLGLGVQPPTPDWGVMLNDGFTVIGTSVWPIAGPIAALVLVTTSFTVLGETLRDELDPRSAGRVRGQR
jgi:peptide/nickel transport system permease protein